MPIFNIIDGRNRPYQFKKLNVKIEPTRHDNSCVDADQANSDNSGLIIEERWGISLDQAITWAATLPIGVTLYLYDFYEQPTEEPTWRQETTCSGRR